MARSVCADVKQRRSTEVRAEFNRTTAEWIGLFIGLWLGEARTHGGLGNSIEFRRDGGVDVASARSSKAHIAWTDSRCGLTTRARGITCSMNRRGNCYDNAVMESWFSTVKSEDAERFESYAHAKEALFDYIEVFYNQRRRHSTLGQISPAEFERRFNAA